MLSSFGLFFFIIIIAFIIFSQFLHVDEIIILVFTTSILRMEFGKFPCVFRVVIDL